VECYACTNPPTKQCRRCARVYCEIHGGDLCAECLNPASSLPSFNLYRGSLLALLVGTAIAVWLLVRPPGESSEEPPIILGGTPSPQVTREATSETPDGDGTPTTAGTATSAATETPTPPPAPTSTEPQVQTYVVQEGDTLSDIATQFGTTPDAIAAANGITADTPINPGDELIIP
jgi:LysM repeat protein